MQINWIQNTRECSANLAEIIQTEYRFRNQLLLFLIRDAEHLVDYIGNISIDYHIHSGFFSISKNTPEPFYSLLGPEIDYFQPKLRTS